MELSERGAVHGVSVTRHLSRLQEQLRLCGRCSGGGGYGSVLTGRRSRRGKGGGGDTGHLGSASTPLGSVPHCVSILKRTSLWRLVEAPRIPKEKALTTVAARVTCPKEKEEGEEHPPGGSLDLLPLQLHASDPLAMSLLLLLLLCFLQAPLLPSPLRRHSSSPQSSPNHKLLLFSSPSLNLERS